MYLCITERCQMSCEHCCMNAGPEGDDMSMEVFQKALELCDTDDYITLGGGEPTLHKDVLLMLGLVVLTGYHTPLIITNGGVTDVALKLAHAAKKGVIHAELSQDYYHDSIEQEVIEAFTEGSRNGSQTFSRRYPDNDLRRIRDVGDNVCDLGRAANWGTRHQCACSDIFVDPRGDIWACGCKLEKIGTVWEGYTSPEYYDDDEVCSRDRFDKVAEEYYTLFKQEHPGDNASALEDLLDLYNLVDKVDGWNRYLEMRGDV